MNATTQFRRHAAARQRSPQAWPIRRRKVTPHVVLHLLVGALTLVSAQALFKPLTRSWEATMSTSVAYAEQPTTGPATIVAPSLSTTAAAASSSPQQQAGRPDVMTDLGATFGRPASPVASEVAIWRGIAGQDVYRRLAPNRSQPPVGQLKAGTPVEVVDWVSGEEIESHNDTWAALSDGTYVFSTSLRRNPLDGAPALPADAPTAGRWVDVNLTQQIATAYEGRTAVRTALISSGRPGWETPTGVFPVRRRTEKDTMDGATLVGQGPNGTGASYRVENVRYVQYFTDDGAAIHENYWRRPATFGMPGSHGCIGMAPSDAAWFWEFATVGTPLVIHE